MSGAPRIDGRRARECQASDRCLVQTELGRAKPGIDKVRAQNLAALKADKRLFIASLYWSRRWSLCPKRDVLVALEDGRAVGALGVDDRRIWRAFGLQPHRAKTFQVSNGSLFVEKVYDIVGLYLNPPEAAVMLSVDEKSQVQALARSQPAFPMIPGLPEKRTHDYVRHGTTSLFPAFNTAEGTARALVSVDADGG
jgi:hypothetical protein